MVSIKIKKLKQVEGVFDIVILLNKKGVKKFLKYLKLVRHSKVLGVLGKVSFKVLFRYIWEELYLYIK